MVGKSMPVAASMLLGSAAAQAASWDEIIKAGDQSAD
jgi:hypothetical protein